MSTRARVLSVHSYYQHRSGEDVVFELEADLLEARGHSVWRETFSNESIPDNRSLVASGALAASTIWSRSSESRLRKIIRKFKPDIAHFHNTFPLVSPSGYAACRKEGVPVVQTLHNYRSFCSNAQLFRDGGICHDCIGKFMSWPGVVHRCYRNSIAMSATLSAMHLVSNARKSRQNDVDIYMAISHAVRDTFVRAGFPPDRILVKPHFVYPDPGPGRHEGDFALYVGRLTEEKGVASLLEAWDRAQSGISLKIIGDGPMASEVREASSRNSRIEWLGSRPMNQVLESIGEASLLVFPSIWQEPFGRTIIEAYARGTPVVASDVGASVELIRPGETGELYRAGSSADLIRHVQYLMHHPSLLQEMGKAARLEFEMKFTASLNYSQLIEIYHQAIAKNGSRRDIE